MLPARAAGDCGRLVWNRTNSVRFRSDCGAQAVGVQPRRRAASLQTSGPCPYDPETENRCHRSKGPGERRSELTLTFEAVGAPPATTRVMVFPGTPNTGSPSPLNPDAIRAAQSNETNGTRYIASREKARAAAFIGEIPRYDGQYLNWHSAANAAIPAA